MPLITVTDAPVRDAAADVLILPLVPGADEAPATVPGSPEISQAIAGLDASASRGDIHRIPSNGLAAATSLLLVGIGEEDLTAAEEEELRLAFGAATRSLSGVDTAAMALPGGSEQQLAAAVEGAALGAYAFIAHKSDADKAKPALTSLIVLSEDPSAQAAAERAGLLSEVVDITRDLVNTPPNLLYRSEERRVGKECTAGWSPEPSKRRRKGSVTARI